MSSSGVGQTKRNIVDREGLQKGYINNQTKKN